MKLRRGESPVECAAGDQCVPAGFSQEPIE